MAVRLEVWGEYALFSRPELKVERVTYDIMTPSAARGILESIYWHPGLAWKVDRIYVMSKIKYVNIRRNEIDKKIPKEVIKNVMAGDLCLNAKTVQRASLALKDVHYVIEAHFIMTDEANATDNPGKFQDIIKRRIKRGQCYHNPYLGCREFPAKFRLYEFDDIPTVYDKETENLGLMLYDFDYSDADNITPMFFRAVLKKGILDLKDCEVYK